MVLITIVMGVYKPTNITGGPHIVGSAENMFRRKDVSCLKNGWEFFSASESQGSGKYR